MTGPDSQKNGKDKKHLPETLRSSLQDFEILKNETFFPAVL